jgi:hypothetical protein
MRKVRTRVPIGILDEDLFNVLQLSSQALTLPICTKESARMAGIRHEDLKKLELTPYRRIPTNPGRRRWFVAPLRSGVIQVAV